MSTSTTTGSPGSSVTAGRHAAASRPGPRPRQGRAPSWLAPVLVLTIGTFVAVLDVSIVNVAIPRIQRDFGASTVDIQWITTAYSLTIGVLVPASGWLADRIGLRRTYVIALIAFAITSALCGLAWDLPSLVVFRILQAIPGGVLPVVTLSMVYRIVPRKEIGAAMGLFGMGVVLAPALGPTLGGYLVEYFNWRLIFFINVPVGLLGALAAAAVLTEFRSPPATRFDTGGFGTIALSLFALLLAFTKAPDWGWSSYRVGILIVGGLLSLALFVLIELEVDDPLLDVRLLANWAFTNTLLLLIVLSVGMFAVLFYIPLYLQNGHDVQPMRTGLILLPEAVAMGATTLMSGILYDWIGPRWPIAIGLGIAALGTFLMCGITADTTDVQIVLWTWIRGVGNGLAMMSIITAGLASAPPDKLNRASAMNNVAQRVASALGLAMLVALATHQQAQLMTDQLGITNITTLPRAHIYGTGQHLHDLPALYSAFLHLRFQAVAASYADMFLVIALITAAAAIAAAVLTITPTTTPSPEWDQPTDHHADTDHHAGVGPEAQPENFDATVLDAADSSVAGSAGQPGGADPVGEFTAPAPRDPTATVLTPTTSPAGTRR